jgi:hypothetical protein
MQERVVAGGASLTIDAEEREVPGMTTNRRGVRIADGADGAVQVEPLEARLGLMQGCQIGTHQDKGTLDGDLGQAPRVRGWQRTLDDDVKRPLKHELVAI